MGETMPSDCPAVSIAVEGCCHGELDAIYDRLSRHEEATGRKVDLLLICGDFESIRNFSDFHSLAVPPKYRTLGTFHRYYSGEKVAPILTVFVGGNHEASQPLQELPYGGWVAPRIYYMGYAGVVRFNGIRIGGLSGIYKSHDYRKGRFETPPFDNSTMRSAYHVRNMDVYRLQSYAASTSHPLEVMLSHDWPQGVEQYGDTARLLRQKPHFQDEVARNDLGSPANRQLLDSLKPKWWFAAHLHVKFKASVVHGLPQGSSSSAPATSTTLVPSQTIRKMPEAASEETAPDSSDIPSTESTTQFVAVESTDSCCNGPDLTQQMTRFLSLDKCLPRRQCLAILHLPVADRQPDPKLEYDLEWLAVLSKTHELTQTHHGTVTPPSILATVTDADVEQARKRLEDCATSDDNFLDIPMDGFVATVPAHAGPTSPLPRPLPPPLPQMGNPQTDRLLGVFGLRHIGTIPFSQVFGNELEAPICEVEADENEIDLESEEGSTSAPGNASETQLEGVDEAKIGGDSKDATEASMAAAAEISEDGTLLAKKPRMES
jgi:lariat debranching enzyme